MPVPLHRILDKNLSACTGTCSVCGPVTLTKAGGCGDVHKLRLADWRAQNRQRVRDQKHARRYGSPAEHRAALFERQGRRCPICGKGEADLPPHAWHLDHDHRFKPRDRDGHRGILCRLCNIGLGCFFDNPQNFRNAERYLLRWQNWLDVVT